MFGMRNNCVRTGKFFLRFAQSTKVYLQNNVERIDVTNIMEDKTDKSHL